VHALDDYGSGSQSINWDFALYPTTDDGSFVPQPSSLSHPSSAALTGSLTSSPDLSLNYASSWNTFSFPSGHEQYLGNDSQLLSGGTIPFTSLEDPINAVAITMGTAILHGGQVPFSTPMVKGMTNTSSILTHLLILYRSLIVRFLHWPALSRLFVSRAIYIYQGNKLQGQSPRSRSFQS
jgi:hypothetical protein